MKKSLLDRSMCVKNDLENIMEYFYEDVCVL